MKRLKVGIMPLSDFQAYTRDIAAGRYRRKRGEPKVWFSSMAALAQILSDRNRELLALIAEREPESLSELADLSGRAQSSLTRTLKKMEGYGLVTIERGKRGRLKPTVPYSDIVLNLSIGAAR